MAIKKTTRKPAAKKPAAKKTAAKRKPAKIALRGTSDNPYAGMVCMVTNANGSRSFTTPNASSAVTCPNGGVLVEASKYLRNTTVKAVKTTSLNAPAKKKAAKKKPSVKRACRSLIKSEGVKQNGQLKKGYRRLKGGRVVKAKAKN